MSFSLSQGIVRPLLQTSLKYMDLKNLISQKKISALDKSFVLYNRTLATLDIEPKVSLVDERIQTVIRGLQPLEKGKSSCYRFGMTYNFLLAPLKKSSLYSFCYTYFSVTLRVEGTNKTNLSFASLTHYCANEEGIVDLSEQPPVEHPDYNEPDSMGIFWSMHPMQNSDTRFWSNNVSEGLFYKFDVYEGI